MPTITHPTSLFPNSPTFLYFTSLLATNFPLYDQYIELFKRGYLAGHVMAAGVQHLLTTPAICELHEKILENGYVLEPVYEEAGYWRLLKAVEVVYVSMVNRNAFQTVVVMTRMVAGDVLGERGRRDWIRDLMWSE
jgi:hypothetical protein